MLIRQETSKDYEAVYRVVKTAFAYAEKSDGTEQDLVTALRGSAAFIPELSLVAEWDNKIVGHILFTRLQIGNHTELALAPLAVLPDYQRRGIGTALIKEGHRIAKEFGFCYVVVLGSEKYYPKMGYIPAKQYGIRAPFAVPDENFMACRLRDNAPLVQGVVSYAPEFGIE